MSITSRALAVMETNRSPTGSLTSGARRGLATGDQRPRPQVETPLIPISHPIGAAWHVVMTNIKCEFRAAMGIRSHGFEVYLPVERLLVRHARRSSTKTLPLFRRYIFVAFDSARDEWFAPIKLTDGVEDVLSYPRAGDGPDIAWMPLRVPTAEIDAIKRKEAAGDFDYTNPSCAFKPGETVRIADAGNMTGLNAIVHDTPPGKRVEILLSLLGRQTIVRLEANKLEKA